MSVVLRVGAVKPIETQEVHYGSGDEASSSYTDADVLDIPLPEHTYQRPLPPTSSASQSSTGYIGLPYQDHNYGMPPPPSPPRPASPNPPSPFEDNGMIQIEEEVKTTPLVSVVEEVVEDSITRCICGYLHDDGYMICCDKCSVWQHIDCMGVDRNNIPDSYFCELCQPRVLDAIKAKAMQKRKREELAARNVLSDSSATDTDPEEAANALASMGKKLPASKKKNLKQKRAKAKEKPPLKLKIRKALAQKVKKPGKKEKENMTSPKPPKKHMKSAGSLKGKSEKGKNRTPLILEQVTGDPWNSNYSPWVDSYDYAHENQYSPSVRDFSSNSTLITQAVDISSIMPDQLLAHLTCVAEVRKNRKGLRALQEIPAGQAIIEYKGNVMLRHDYDKERAFVNCFTKLQPFVLFYSQLDVDICVDARTYGNEARFVRRSCTPNAEVKHILSQGKLYFVILSKKDIMCGFEVTIPFDYNHQDCTFSVECACKKNNCVVSRYWKKMKNSQKTPQNQKEHGVKRKRQSSGNDGGNLVGVDHGLSSPLGSPGKNLSPVKVMPPSSPPKLASPVKFSNVSTLLAASALLDGKLDLAGGLDLEANELSQQPVPAVPQLKPATSSRRLSKVSEDSIKEEKSVAALLTPTKEKAGKTKETTKSKGKDKESKVHTHIEVKKERRLSSRRQSHDDIDDTTDNKTDSSSAAHSSGTELEESSGTTHETQKKMTREERKLDAIMKVFEKMEKREERRKEAMARGDQGTKRSSVDSKPQKMEDTNGSQSRSNSQDGPSDTAVSIKEEQPTSEVSDTEKQPELKPEESNTTGTLQKLPLAADVKSEKTEDMSLKAGGLSDGPSPGISPPSQSTHESRLGSLDSSAKISRKPGKRKRRRSRVYSTTAVSDAASVSAEEGNSNSSFPPAPLSTPVTPASTPLPSEDPDAGIFKYVKTKKHLFDEWAHKHEDETKQEMFVECLPNPHVNTMDHLQRRNSQSSGSGHRGPEAGGGSAKKRWLRQAMHEVPTPVAFNHSLSVSTDSGSASPIQGSSSPNPGIGLGSPGAGSPLDFVTPLKKRRLIRESLGSEMATSPSAGILTEGIATNGVGISTKTNGIKQMFPATRHSTDDRIFLHKGYPHKNGFSEVVLFTEGNGQSTSNSVTNVTSLSSHHGAERQNLGVEQGINSDAVWRTEPRVNGVPEGVHMPVGSLSQPASSSASYPLKFRGLLERIAVDHSSETREQEAMPVTSSSRNLQGSATLTNPILTSSSSPPKRKESVKLDSSVPMPPVVVVNSNVYNGVNSLMEEEGSETGVTAKSIMNEDSPATVRIDLNAHEIEPPSSLSDTSSNVVVNLDDSLFNVSLQKEHQTEMAECPVNSSEDVEIFPAARGQSRVSFNICDNTCTNSNSREDTRGPVVAQEFSMDNQQVDTADMVDSSQAVVTACDEQRNTEAVSASSAGEDVMPGPSSATSQSFESGPQSVPAPADAADCISSSGQVCLPLVDRVVVELSTVCDSAENSSVGEHCSSWTQERQCTSRSDLVEAAGLGQSDAEEEGTRADSNGDSRCDSVGSEQNFAPDPMSRANEQEDNGNVEMADSNSAESRSVTGLSPSIITSGNAMDNNVDSTSSEAKQLAAPATDFQTARYSFCDSNSDLNTVTRNGQRNSVASDDSCSESMGVSSSETCVSSRRHEDPYPEGMEEEETGLRQVSSNSEVLSNNEVSTVTSETLQFLPSGTHQGNQLEWQEYHEEQPTESSNISRSVTLTEHSNVPRQPQTTSSSATFSSTTPSSSSSSSLLPSSSLTSVTSAVLDTSSSPKSPSSSGLLSTQPIAGCTTTSSSQTATATSPISSSMEAAPVVKKKVSLLEYRKRLKEKPASTTEVKTTSSSSATPASSPLPVTTHHKLSTTLSLFLSGSSPTSSFSSSSTSSLSPTKGSSSSHSTNHGLKKSRMPTLATLPLFKSSDPKKDEKKKPKLKPEKPLSLSDRLRLEFGLEDMEDSSRKKKNGTKPPRWKSASPPPPPPPLHPPHPLSILSSDLSMPHHPPSLRCSTAEEADVVSSNGTVDNSVPPPPPPPLSSAYPVSTTGVRFGLASTVRPSPGAYVGSTTQLLNGIRSGHVFQQQPQQQHSAISSTSLNLQPSVAPRHPHPGHTVIDQQQTSKQPPPPGYMGPPYKPLFPHSLHQPQASSSSSLSSPSSAMSSSTSTQRQIHNSVLPHSSSWGTGGVGQVSSATHHSVIPQPSAGPSHMQQLSQRQQPRTSVQLHPKTMVTGNVIPDDRPPPPPPPPPRLHHHHQFSTSSSSHRFHNHQGLVGKSKSNKAASSSSSHSSSSSSSYYPDNRSRY